MKIYDLKTLVAISLLTCFSKICVAQIKVVLKLDDIGAKNNTCKALPIMDYLLKRKVKASYGIIANRLDETAKPLLADVLAAVDEKGKPMVEFWHHGLDHARKGDVFEFKNAPYQQQKQHFDSAHNSVKKYLDVEMTAFGAPFNATDSTTLKVITEHPSYKVLFFSRVEVNFALPFKRLNNNVPMEKETGKPDFEYFKSNYEKHKSYLSDNIVLQGHPPYWTAEGFDEFKKILDFLDHENAVYLLPTTLALNQSKK